MFILLSKVRYLIFYQFMVLFSRMHLYVLSSVYHLMVSTSDLAPVVPLLIRGECSKSPPMPFVAHSKAKASQATISSATNRDPFSSFWCHACLYAADGARFCFFFYVIFWRGDKSGQLKYL